MKTAVNHTMPASDFRTFFSAAFESLPVHGATSTAWFIACRCRRSGLEQTIVFVVRSDPEPLGFIVPHDCQRAELAANARGPKSADPFEMERRMPRIAHPEFEILASQLTNRRRQRRQTLTKAWGRRGLHQAPPLVDRIPPLSSGNRPPPACRFWRPLRFAGPRLPRRAPSSGATVRETPQSEESRQLLRFRPACSQREYGFNGAALASRFATPLKHNGAAARRRRNGSDENGPTSPKIASMGPQVCPADDDTVRIDKEIHATAPEIKQNILPLSDDRPILVAPPTPER